MADGKRARENRIVEQKKSFGSEIYERRRKNEKLR